MKKKLKAADRDFFSLVKEATFINPFADERRKVDMKIIGSSADMPEHIRVRRLTQEVRNRVIRLEESGSSRISQFEGEDRTLMETVFLFDFFHQFLLRFDRLILEQQQAGEKSVKVNFWREAFAFLAQRDFAEKEIRHFFALCYQLRRAYFFIKHSLVGRSDCMKKLRRNLWNNVFTHDMGLYNTYMWNRMEDFSTLILGETGTGKGSSAMSVGRSGFIPFDEKKESFSESFVRSFVSLNLSQFPETLIESELFGHRKGAFTGAAEDYQGIFDRCSPYGSVFMDEVGEVSIPIQIKLLQILQERTYSPVGGHQKRRFQGRVIAATNRDFREMRKKGLLRDDFFYRLCSDIIIVPPLRQRIREDPLELDDLLAHTVERIVGTPSPELVHMVRSVIAEKPGPEYPWSGNVRELEQCVRRILLKRRYEGDDEENPSDLQTFLSRGTERGDLDAPSLLGAYCMLLYRRFGTYEAAARRSGLDRRTVKKYIDSWEESGRTGSRTAGEIVKTKD
ncbi:MAG: sigma 54-interacting transcriptional regulator [Desulfococcaceae bacterium]|jgi:DNA-binding NtrC family response regulator|nr:sigma 54-interacting transcriptional regulator [Desulfococcaceae bacterium]